MGVFLLRENPEARMREPSRGDGGVDVYEPYEDGYRVYQIKGFSARIGSSQRTQIKKSLASTKSAPRLDAPVRDWQLVVPTTLTSGEEAWFKKLVKGAAFSTSFQDEAFWISLAAKYPDVVDFYLGNGRERLRRNQRSLRHLLEDPSNELLPADIQDRISGLREAINNESPHYRYEFRTSAKLPGPPDDQSLLVASYSYGSEEKGFITWDIYGKFEQATDLDPITIGIKIRSKDESGTFDISDGMREFFDFGVGVELPDGALTEFEVNSPGGLSDGGEGKASARLGSAYVEEFQPHTQRFQVENRNGEVVAEALVDMLSMTRGRRGMEVRGIEQGDAFEVTERIVIDEDDPTGGHFGLNIQYRGLAGKRAVDVLEGMRFIRALSEHNNIVVRPEFGPQEVARGPAAGQQWEGLAPMARLVENLAVLQRRTMLPIVVPETVPSEEYAEIAVAAHLIEGGEINGNWGDASIEPVDIEEAREWAQSKGDEGGALALPGNLDVTIAGTTYHLGEYHTILESAKVVDDSDGTLSLAPGSSDHWVRRFGPPPEPPQE